MFSTLPSAHPEPVSSQTPSVCPEQTLRTRAGFIAWLPVLPTTQRDPDVGQGPVRIVPALLPSPLSQGAHKHSS